METRICKRKECNNLIATSKRSDSIYCTPICGARDRNEKKRKATIEKRLYSRKVETNYKIIESLYTKGVYDVSIESLELMDFDFDYCTGIDDIDIQKGIMRFRVYEFLLTPHDNRYKISKPAS